MVPRYVRLDDGVPTRMTEEEVKPIVLAAMTYYADALKSEYGEFIVSPEEATERSLKEHNIVLINGEYLLAYILGTEWYARGCVLSEEYLIRVRKGPTTLSDVFSVMKALALIHGARGCQIGTRAAKNKEAIRRLYQRHGSTETMTVMRI